MSEHPRLEFVPQTPRSPILPSIAPLVLFIISMVKSTCHHLFCYGQFQKVNLALLGLF